MAKREGPAGGFLLPVGPFPLPLLPPLAAVTLLAALLFELGWEVLLLVGLAGAIDGGAQGLQLGR